MPMKSNAPLVTPLYGLKSQAKLLLKLMEASVASLAASRSPSALALAWCRRTLVLLPPPLLSRYGVGLPAPCGLLLV
jgi:hypothetical protein